jgi:hypothetical protein
MDRSSRILSAAVAFVGSAIAAQAGPCTTQISQVEAQIQRDQAAAQPGGAGVPSAPQSVAAQLHHQPTAQSVDAALSQANADGVAALDRAKKADATGNARECTDALAEAKQLYGLQ